MTPEWRDMDTARRDGRHILLRTREATFFKGAGRWCGGVVAHWTDDDRWYALSDPRDLTEGTGYTADSYYFTGWLPLPDEEAPDSAKPPPRPVT